MCPNRLEFYFILKRVFRSEFLFRVPVPDRPIAQIRRRRKLFPRIHGIGVPHRVQHPPVQQGVSASARLSQNDLHCPRHHFHRSPLSFSIIRFPPPTSDKHSVSLF